MEQSLVSIIIPVYNREKTLGRCVESVLNQTYQNLEIILVDDGSKDRSVEIAKKYAKEDRRIKVIAKKNGGVSSARNTGIDAAAGEYLQFLDSDDYIENNMVEDMVYQLQTERTQLAVCGFRELHSSRPEIIRKPETKTVTLVKNMDSRVKGLIENCLLQSSCNKLYVRSLIRERFTSNLHYGEDLLFCLAYLKGIEKIVFLDKAYYIYDQTGESLTSHYRKNEIEIRIELLKSVYAFSDQYLDGKQCEKDFSTKMMRAVIYSMFDVYRDSDGKQADRNKRITNWIKDPVIQRCSHVCDLNNRQQRICNYLIKHQLSGILRGLFFVKKKCRLY